MCYNEGLRANSLPQRWKLPSLRERVDAPLRVGRGGPTELVDEEPPIILHKPASPHPSSLRQLAFGEQATCLRQDAADTFPAGEGFLLYAFAKQKPAA